uniref:ATP synthase complex subunit 8 n=1 Tax=Pseudoclavellaria amerinae TaxID=2798532 RepID=A0A977XS90_9HYME|nr:ATP synthase F0 subunit 8 [Pseudoclavellaria amerinae]UXW64319.1 ATP synthase F0 subunit 8 [Pseudoclavellaria amerinae]
MPQMYPMEWLNLYIYFMILFYTIIMLNYYSVMSIKLKIMNKNQLNPNKKMNWKW